MMGGVMSAWSNGKWWVLDANRDPLHGPLPSMGECEHWLQKRLGSLPPMTRNEVGHHGYATGHFIIEETGYGAKGLAQKVACPDCFLVHTGDCP